MKYYNLSIESELTALCDVNLFKTLKTFKKMLKQITQRYRYC